MSEGAPQSTGAEAGESRCECGHSEDDHDWSQEFDGDNRPINAPYQVCFRCVHDDLPGSAHEFREVK